MQRRQRAAEEQEEALRKQRAAAAEQEEALRRRVEEQEVRRKRAAEQEEAAQRERALASARNDRFISGQPGEKAAVAAKRVGASSEKLGTYQAMFVVRASRNLEENAHLALTM